MTSWQEFLEEAFDKLNSMPDSGWFIQYQAVLRHIASRAFDRSHQWTQKEVEQVRLVAGGLQIREPDDLARVWREQAV